jgi:acyl-CoA synthetase (AMP-forming)/AMP-acid ligase II
LTDVFVGLASRYKSRTAVVSPQLSLSYAELLIRAARSARELRASGIEPGARVAIALRDSGETVVLMIALWMLGATPVPVDFRSNATERGKLATEFDLLAVLEDRQSPAASYATVLVDASWSDRIARHDASPLWPSGASAPGLISLTSGTTSRPVGFVLDHDRVLFRSMTPLPARYGGSLLNPLALSFSGSRSHTLSALFQGATVRFYPVLFSPEELAEAIVAWKVGSVCAVPTIIRALLELSSGRPTPLFAELEGFYSIGAPMLAEEKLAVGKVLCRYLIQDYGSTVSGCISSLYGPDLEARPETVGRVQPFVALQVVDDEDRVLPFGEVGNIRVRTPGMARTMYGGGGPRASGDTLKEGWAYPGDIGALDDAGFVTLMGRSSDLIIRGGANVHPSEVEAVIAQHESVRDVVVVGFTKLPQGQEIAAFVVCAGNLTEAALDVHCCKRLAPDKRPRRFVFVPDLPRNANGKILRAELRKQLEEAG